MIFIILIFILLNISSAIGDASRDFSSIISINFNISHSYKLHDYYSNTLDILDLDVTKKLDSDETYIEKSTNTNIIRGFDLSYCPRYFIVKNLLFAPSLDFSLCRKYLKLKIANKSILSSGYTSEYNQNTFLVSLTPDFGFCFFNKTDKAIFSKVTFSPSIRLGCINIYGDIDERKLYEFVLVPAFTFDFLFPLKQSALGFNFSIGSKYETIFKGNRKITKTFADYYTKSAEFASEIVSFYISFGILFAIKNRCEKLIEKSNLNNSDINESDSTESSNFKDVSNCEMSFEKGIDYSKKHYSALGWGIGGFFAGFGGALPGMGVVIGCAAGSNPEPDSIPEGVDIKCFKKGYKKNAKPRRVITSILSATSGFGVWSLLLWSVIVPSLF